MRIQLLLAVIVELASCGRHNNDGSLNVLVFGDSQGDTGPTWKALRDVLYKQKVKATVINKSIGGTKACAWATDPNAIVKA